MLRLLCLAPSAEHGPVLHRRSSLAQSPQPASASLPTVRPLAKR